MPQKTARKPLFEPDFKSHDFSNPSGSTFNPLTINELADFTDKVLTKNNKIRKLKPTLFHKMQNFKKPEIYDAGGDIKRQWFVYYSFRHPDTGRFERIKVFKDINTGKTKAERYELAKYYKEIYSSWLEAGGSPFEILGDTREQNIIVCLEKFITYVQDSKLRKNTRKKYELEMNVFKRWIETSGLTQLLIGEIKKQHIFEFIEYVKKRGKVKSGKTVNHYLNDLRRFFNHYIDNYDDYLERNPASKITRDQVETKGNIAYTDEEFEAIKQYLLEKDPYLWFVCQVIYYTGLRNEAEALELRCGGYL